MPCIQYPERAGFGEQANILYHGAAFEPSSEQSMTILVVGDANADISAALVRFPTEGDDTQITALEWGSGGSATNVAAALGRLGARARLFARVGADPAAEIALRVARAADVDLRNVQADPAIATGLCYAAVSPGGERTFFSFRGANVALAPAPATLLDGARWLHISAYALFEGAQRRSTLELLDTALVRGLPISLDLCLPVLRAWHHEIEALLPHLAILFANEHELVALCPAPSQDAAATQLLGTGLPLAVIKLGPRGCLLAAPGLNQQFPTFPVAALDTNGCGDAFVAGFLAAYLRGGALQYSVGLANAMGALTATRYGAAEALPTREELAAFLHAQPEGEAIARLLDLPNQ